MLRTALLKAALRAESLGTEIRKVFNADKRQVGARSGIEFLFCFCIS
jgi:hypothetical protein